MEPPIVLSLKRDSSLVFKNTEKKNIAKNSSYKV